MYPYPDIVVVCCDKEYNLHRLILSQIPYFQPIIDPNSDWYEPVIVVDFEQRAWELLVEILYQPMKIYTRHASVNKLEGEATDNSLEGSISKLLESKPREDILELASLADMLDIHWFDALLEFAIRARIPNTKIVSYKDYYHMPLVATILARAILNKCKHSKEYIIPSELVGDIIKILAKEGHEYEDVIRRLSLRSGSTPQIEWLCHVAKVLHHRKISYLEPVWKDVDDELKKGTLIALEPRLMYRKFHIIEEDSKMLVDYRVEHEMYVHPLTLKKYGYNHLIEKTLLSKDTSADIIKEYLPGNTHNGEDCIEGIAGISHNIENYKILRDRLKEGKDFQGYGRMLDKLISTLEASDQTST